MDDASSSDENEESPPYDLHKKSKNGDKSSKRSMKRQLKTFSFGKWQKGFGKGASSTKSTKKQAFSLSKENWQSSNSVISESSVENVTCICTGYKKSKGADKDKGSCSKEKYCGPKMEEVGATGGECWNGVPFRNGYEVHAPIGETSANSILAAYQPQPLSINELTLALQEHMRLSLAQNPLIIQYGNVQYNTVNPDGISATVLPINRRIASSAHTQIDYVHHLVPDLLEITNCGFYWGKMDRYKAEKQLEKRPEGTFLLRDSAQEEYLFSVSFRRYGRTLHARIEQLNHKFSFDSHDPNVFTTDSVCGLVEHYKNPICCMFFEPMLTIPVHRNFPFDLQHLCRAVISDRVTYDGINDLKLPKKIRSYLKEYHYKQKVRVRHLDNDNFV